MKELFTQNIIRLFRNVLVLLIIGALGSCVSDLTVQKRKYRSGWHIERRGDVVAHSASRREIKLHPTELEQLRQASLEIVHTPNPVGEAAIPEAAIDRPGIMQSREDLPAISGEALGYVSPVRSGKPARSAGVKRYHGNRLIWSVVGSIMLTSGLIVVLRRRVRRLSEWARQNIQKARLVLIAGHLSLGFGAFYGGYFAGLEGLHVDQEIVSMSFGVFLLAMLTYPFRGLSKAGEWGFVRRKLRDLVLFSSGVIILFSQGAAIGEGREPGNELAAAAVSVLIPEDSAQQVEFSEVDPVNEPKPPQKDVPVIPILQTMLALVIFVFLAALLASIACNLSCSGQETAAAIVGIGGGAVLLIVLVIAIRYIWRTWNAKQKEKMAKAVEEG